MEYNEARDLGARSVWMGDDQAFKEEMIALLRKLKVTIGEHSLDDMKDCSCIYFNSEGNAYLKKSSLFSRKEFEGNIRSYPEITEDLRKFLKPSFTPTDPKDPLVNWEEVKEFESIIKKY